MTKFIVVVLYLFAGIIAAQELKVGSKKFTESVILGDMAALLGEIEGIKVDHKKELGGTQILWSALLKGDIDIYPEYTGTLQYETLVSESLFTIKDLENYLNKIDIKITPALGFNNTYAIGMPESRASELRIKNISDLQNFPDLKFGFGNEFLNRADGWPALRETYLLPQKNIRGLDHDLAYRGLASNSIDVIDLYSTDAEIKYYNIAVLKDDKNLFPEYQALFVYRKEIQTQYPDYIETINLLSGKISETDMVKMNAAVKIEKEQDRKVAAGFLEKNLSLDIKIDKEDSLWKSLLKHTVDHLYLVLISLFSAILLAIPLGILAVKVKKAEQVVLSISGIIQTIPSLALLVFMIPLLGIGSEPAIAALFLYSLLPIVRNTHSGLKNIPEDIQLSARAIGLSGYERLRFVEMPLAAGSILAGIKTSAVINVGTATLGALIGAGGYGQPILTGIRLDDIGLILQGAIPAAFLALLVQGFFDLIEKLIIPKVLRNN